DATAQQGVGEVGGDGGAFALVLDVAGDRRQVGLAAGGVHVAVQLGALAHQAQPGAEQVAQAAAFARVGVGGREVAAVEEAGVGLGFLAVAFGLAAMLGFYGPVVAEDEGDGVIAAGVGEPVPAVHALAGDEEPTAEGSDGAEKGVGVGGQ